MGRWPGFRRWARLSALLAALLVCREGFGQEDEDHDEQPLAPGLVASYASEHGPRAIRLDERLSFHWHDGVPDERISAGLFSARWRGHLLAQGSGEYRLYVFAAGEVEVRLGGKIAIPRQRLESAWAASEPLNLSFDHHPLDVSFRQIGQKPHIALFWSGPQFSLEPVAPRFLWHDRKLEVDESFERGRWLATALRCTACHGAEAEKMAMPAPSLVNLPGNIEPVWLIDWLTRGDQPGRRMPHYGLSPDDATAIAAYLLKAARLPSNRGTEAKLPANPGRESRGDVGPGGRNQEKEKQAPSAAQGERHFLTLGCLACHKLGKLGESGLFGGGDLSNIAAKRPSTFFDRWLADPSALNRQHRMPVFELSPDERQSLSLFLANQRDSKVRDPAPLTALPAGDDALISRGRELVARHRCGACHELPEAPQLVAKSKALDKADWRRSCAKAVDQTASGLGYGLPEDEQADLAAYFRVAHRTPKGNAVADGPVLLATNNCLACHSRDGDSFAAAAPAGLADKLASVGEVHSELAALIPAMTPPSLNSVGDKLRNQALEAAIGRRGPPHRPYLLVRMPRFPLNGKELAALAQHFVTSDRIPPNPPTPNTKAELDSAAASVAGGRLVSTDGFGCVSCHQVGSVLPDKAPLNARGPNLSQLDQRLRREWFDRFMPNPARIVPRMEMPSVQIAVKGVLNDNIDTQLEAVWYALNTPGFTPPEPNPVRVLRTSGTAERNDRPIVINDVAKVGDRTFIQPLIIGLPNRQNFLYDLSESRLAAWWLGDTARQRTRGKSWHWEPGGPMVLPPDNSPAELAILRRGERLVPLRRSQHVAELSRYETTSDGGVTLLYWLSLGDAERPTDPIVTMSVSEEWRVGADRDRPSLRNLVVRWKVLPGDRLVCQIVPPAAAEKAELIPGEQTFRLAGKAAGAIQVLRSATGWSLAADGTATASVSASEGGAELALSYASYLAPDTIDSAAPEFHADAEIVEVAPGLSARRLPLPVDWMPTALAWRTNPAGKDELVIGSLKGQIVAARDADGDGLEDATRLLGDGLATPYGLHADGERLEVLTKSALLGIKEDRVEVLAAGWGHTDDYHDWAVGLPRNEKGEYFIGLPCQQDQRSAAAAKYRGAVLKLTPRSPSGANRFRYELGVVSTGHRFPMGLALSKQGELFVTDNQGNYNPFNELNHVRPGAFFGFINANDKQDESFRPPPLDPPAIDIPHPWTRSVNGICFLNTPQTLLDQGIKDAFGPLEGHLVGCEYDTRRLIRLSLHKVGDTYQGAAYPLSLEPSSPEKGFLGPVVCAVSPRGELYVGSMRDSGWGAGNNVGEIVQVKIDPKGLAAGIAEVRATSGGFAIDFTQPVDPAKAADPANYSISSYRRESTPAYGGPDVDRRVEKVSGVELSPDHRRATIKLAELREGFGYELRLKDLTLDGSLFHPAEAHYTLKRKPE